VSGTYMETHIITAGQLRIDRCPNLYPLLRQQISRANSLHSMLATSQQPKSTLQGSVAEMSKPAPARWQRKIYPKQHEGICIALQDAAAGKRAGEHTETHPELLQFSLTGTPVTVGPGVTITGCPVATPPASFLTASGGALLTLREHQPWHWPFHVVAVSRLSSCAGW
jgi:hypothetical protein